jgi:alkanesulfonate monooxygenase SsuD/methylene tetrahydromethanopterin reductase-like flavin-dependent oxidoreductase (luciferase family)
MNRDHARQASAVQFGIFDWIDQNAELRLGDIYEQRLKMLELADESRIWCYHLAEHHATPLGVAPSPNLFLAAAAQRTKRLRLGPMVQLLPLYNPLRNIEEVCFLDNLSDGRLELGIGRGISAEELAVYGISAAESRDRFQECFDILMMGLSTGRVSYEGRYYSIKDAPVSVTPQQKPYPPLWYPTSNAERIPWVAEQGFNTLFGFNRTGLEQIASGIAQYRSVYATHRNDAGRLNGHVPEPLLGATRHVYVAESDDEALETARRAYTAFDRNFLTRPGRDPAGESRRGDFDTAISWGGIFAGSPETVRRQVQEFIDETGANYFVGTFAFGSLTTEQILSSMRLFAKEIMPSIAGSAPAGEPAVQR